MGKKVSDEYIKNEMIRLFNIYGDVPTKRQINENCSFNAALYHRRFGSVYNACVEYGLVAKKLTTEERIRVSIIELKEMYNKLNKVPTVYEYDSMRMEGFARRDLEKNLKLNWNSIITQCLGTNPNVKRVELVDKSIIINNLRNFEKSIGRVPYMREIRKYNIGYSYNHILKCMNKNTMLEVYDEIGWDVEGTTTVSMSDQDMIESYIMLFNELGRLPSAKDLKDCAYTPTQTTYHHRFGGVKKMCEAAGINYYDHFDSIGRGISKLDNNGELCRSLPELEITNFLIDEEIEYEKEVPYDEIVDGTNYRFDWKVTIDGKIYYIEYFGMYAKENPTGQMEKRYVKRAKKKIKLIKESGNIDKCIFLFPEHYDHDLYYDIILNLKGDDYEYK